MQSRRGQSDVQDDINYEKRTYRPNVLPSYRLKKCAFTLAEMMVVMLILSIVMAAMAPVMTTRNKLDQSSPWQWASNGSDAYYALGDAQVAMIGQEEADNTDTSSRLVINAPDGKDHILFKTGDNVLGRIKFKNSGLLIGGLSSGDLVTNSVAVGRNTSVGGSNSTAIGTSSSATNTGATAVGSGASASGSSSNAIGVRSSATRNASTAIGPSSTASGESSNAIGNSAEASGNFSNVLDPSSIGSGISANAIGNNAEASGNNSTAIGNIALASGASSIALGGNTEASMENSTAIGTGAKATANYTNAIGYNSKASGYNSIVLGYNSVASANYSVTLGANSAASGVFSTALGAYAEASGLKSVALAGSASGGGSTALGSNSEASGDGSTVIGASSAASGPYSTAVGYYAQAFGSNNVAIGYNACRTVAGSNKVCIGANSGPRSGSSWASSSDAEERIFIGGQSKFNNATAVLEIHNLSSNSLSNLAQDNDTSVVINGNLIVKGNTFLTTREKDHQNNLSSNRLSLIERNDEDIRRSHNVDDKWITFWNRLHLYLSDRRLKYVGKESSAGLDKIRQLKVFNYTFKKDEKKTPHVGVIAQDLQKVFPDAVKKGVDGFLTIRFEDMFFAMINAIKELDTRVTTLQKENQQLTELLKQVKDDNKELNAVLKQVQNDNKKLDARLKAIEAKIK